MRIRAVGIPSLHPRAHYREPFTDPPFHSALEHLHVEKAGSPQDVRRTGGALLRPSDWNEQARAPTTKILEMV